MRLAQEIIRLQEQGIFIGNIAIGNGCHNGNMPIPRQLAHLLKNHISAAIGQGHAQNNDGNTMLLAAQKLRGSLGIIYINNFIEITKGCLD